MKIVLDSNVIIAAFSGRGLCTSLFELCIEKYNVIISDQILDEVYRILTKNFKIPKNNVNMIINYLKEFCEKKDYEIIQEKICRDKDDDGIIFLAVSNKAEYIITGDKDLLVLKKYKSTKIITPRDFWEISKKDKSI